MPFQTCTSCCCCCCCRRELGRSKPENLISLPYRIGKPKWNESEPFYVFRVARSWYGFCSTTAINMMYIKSCRGGRHETIQIIFYCIGRSNRNSFILLNYSHVPNTCPNTHPSKMKERLIFFDYRTQILAQMFYVYLYNSLILPLPFPANSHLWISISIYFDLFYILTIYQQSPVATHNIV